MHLRHIVTAVLVSVATTAIAQSTTQSTSSNPNEMPPPPNFVPSGGPVRYEPVNGSDRVFYEASHLQRGTTTPVKEADVIRLCGDKDGCTIRMGMHNWDNTERVASREFLFFYNPNPNNKTWRSSYGDFAGTNSNSVVEHVAGPIWSCYFTDGEYANHAAKDTSSDFGLLSWDQYNADCWMTIID